MVVKSTLCSAGPLGCPGGSGKPVQCRSGRHFARGLARAPVAQDRLHVPVGFTRRETAARRTQPRREELLGPLGRRPGVDRVVDEHEPHRPVPRSWLGKLVPGPEEPRQRHGGGDEPDDHADGQDPPLGSQRHQDEARDGDGKPDVPSSEGPDSHPPVSVVLQLRRFAHARDCSTVAGPGSLVLLVGPWVTD
jgi:hypothetical protein